MKQVKTAKGRTIDMGALAQSNEMVRAVSPGNISMNGRGDRIDKSGNVIQTVQTKARAQHDTTHAPERRKLSDVPGAPAKSKAKSTNDELSAEPSVISKETKTREDGTQYIETEYDDGNVTVEEIK